MPSYTNVPPQDGKGPALQLFRTPTKKAIHAIVTSEDLVGCPTHFYQGRTMPHEEDDCEACQHGIPWRWHGYLSAKDCSTSQHFLFEFTARVAESFVAHRETYGTLRGCLFKAKRANDNPNGRVIVQTRQAGLENIALPAGPNLVDCLAILWNLAKPSLSVTDALKDIPRVRVNSNGQTIGIRIADLH